MWFITEFLERTTRSFARTVMKVALLEAEAQRKTLSEARARRALASGLILPERALCVPATIALEPRVLFLPEAAPQPQHALAELVATTEAADAQAAVIDAARPGDVLAAIAEAQACAVTGTFGEQLTAAVDLTDTPLPLGVRGDVVARYVGAFALAAGGGERGALIERLRKDKKVRVAELRFIAAAVLGTEVVHRKKAEHFEALRRTLAPASSRRAAAGSAVPAYL